MRSARVDTLLDRIMDACQQNDSFRTGLLERLSSFYRDTDHLTVEDTLPPDIEASDLDQLILQFK